MWGYHNDIGRLFPDLKEQSYDGCPEKTKSSDSSFPTLKDKKYDLGAEGSTAACKIF